MAGDLSYDRPIGPFEQVRCLTASLCSDSLSQIDIQACRQRGRPTDAHELHLRPLLIM